MTAKPMTSIDSDEGVKNEIDATPKKRRKKTKDIETPRRKKVKKTSVKTEITEWRHHGSDDTRSIRYIQKWILIFQNVS